jgi:hypothetical protein
MLVSMKRKFIFVHIFKNAGTSVKNVLKPHAASRLERFLTRARLMPRPQFLIDHQHPTAQAIRERVGDTIWDTCFKFAIVRNPWDWQTSLYQYILKRNQHPLHATVKQLGSFDAYIHAVCAREHCLYSLQQDFICDEDSQVIVDHVARFESMTSEWDYISKRIGLSSPLPHMNVSKEADYRTYYDNRTVDLVAEAFQPDIDRFGYQFSMTRAAA